MSRGKKDLQMGLEYLRSYTERCKTFEEMISKRSVYQDYIGEMDDETLRVQENGKLEERILEYGTGVMQQENTIRRALERMPERQADLVRLHYLEHLSWKDTARILEMDHLSPAFRDLQVDACSSFWLEKLITGLKEGVTDRILEAKEYRMWLAYFRTSIAPEETDSEMEERFLKEKTGLTQRQGQRRLRLLLLTEDWQSRLRTGRISLGTAYEMSFLEEDLQEQLSAISDYLHLQPEQFQVHKLRALSRREWFRQEAVIQILKPGNTNQSTK